MRMLRKKMPVTNNQRYDKVYNLKEIYGFLNTLDKQQKLDDLQTLIATMLHNTLDNTQEVELVLKNVKDDLFNNTKKFLTQIYAIGKKDLLFIENKLQRFK